MNPLEIKFRGNISFGIVIELIFESLHIIREVYRKGCTCDKCYTTCCVFKIKKSFITELQGELSGHI